MGEGVAQIWIRAPNFADSTSNILSNSVGVTSLPMDTMSSQASRRSHLPADVKFRMKSLCNEICPRDEDGIMLLHKAHPCFKRPAWCIEHIMNALHNEFDSSQLADARDKALSYMARASCTFKR